MLIKSMNELIITGMSMESFAYSEKAIIEVKNLKG